jgi:hypothetical protein
MDNSTGSVAAHYPNEIESLLVVDRESGWTKRYTGPYDCRLDGGFTVTLPTADLAQIGLADDRYPSLATWEDMSALVLTNGSVLASGVITAAALSGDELLVIVAEPNYVARPEQNRVRSLANSGLSPQTPRFGGEADDHQEDDKSDVVTVPLDTVSTEVSDDA